MTQCIRAILAVVLSLVLAACGGGGAEDHSGEPYQIPYIRMSGQLTTFTAASFYLEIFGKQDARPQLVSASLRAGASTYPMNFKDAVICIREYGSSSRCGSVGTVSFRIPDAAGGDFVFDVSSFSSIRSLKWGERLNLEFVIDYSPDTWQPGDIFSLTVTRITYDYDGYRYPQSYIGFPEGTVNLYLGPHASSHGVLLGAMSKKKTRPFFGWGALAVKRENGLWNQKIYNQG